MFSPQVNFLKSFVKIIGTHVIEAPDDYKDGTGTIYRLLNEFQEKNGPEWILQCPPRWVPSGHMIAILIRMDEDFYRLNNDNELKIE